MIEISVMLLFFVSLLAFQNWRQGFTLCVLTAIFQDPFRKMIPGQPVVFVVFVGVVFAAAWFGALTSGVALAPGRISGWRKNVGQPFLFFSFMALLQAVRSLVEYDNPIVTGIGVMSYFAPIPAIVLAYRFALSRDEAGVRHWMWFYVVAATLGLVTVYMEYAGIQWRGLGEVGEGVLISGEGALYKGNAGIFRSAEIAAWHAATVACFSFILFWGRRFSITKILIALLFIAFLLGIGALTARRKMIIEIAIFLSAYFCLLGWFQRGNAKFAVLSALLGVASYTMVVGVMEPDQFEGQYASERAADAENGTFGKYTARAETVFEDIPRRVLETGIEPISWAIDGYGWLGAGLGVGSQGAQHFGFQSSGAAEGGLGKLTVELGVPGLLIAFWLLVAQLRYVWRVMGLLARSSPRHANIAYGVVAYIVANVAAFTVATQAYGDLFILLTLGWSLGFILALPVLADFEKRHLQAQVR